MKEPLTFVQLREVQTNQPSVSGDVCRPQFPNLYWNPFRPCLYPRVIFGVEKGFGPQRLRNSSRDTIGTFAIPVLKVLSYSRSIWKADRDLPTGQTANMPLAPIQPLPIPCVLRLDAPAVTEYHKKESGLFRLHSPHKPRRSGRQY